MAETAAQRRARLQREAEKTKQAEADARARQAEADAAARRAEADAKREQARIEAEAEARRLDAQRQQAELAARQETERRQAAERQAAQDAQNNPITKAWKLGANLLSPAAGYALGKVIASKIEARDLRHLGMRRREVSDLVKAIPRDMQIAAKGGPAGQIALDKLTGAVKSADRLKLQKVGGPLGGVMAGLLIGEGVISRFVLAPQTDNEMAKDALKSLGVGSLFAASALIGQRMLDNATPLKTIGAANQSKLEAARTMLDRLRPGQVPAAAPNVTQMPSGLTKNKVAAAGALLLTVGAGVYGLFAGKANAQPTAPVDEVKPGATGSPLDVARAAALRTTAEMGTTGTLGVASPLPTQNDGFTDAYNRIQNGRTVQVKGYKTPQ